MKLLCNLLCSLACLLLLAACGNDDEPALPPFGSRTVLVYMACDNNLSYFAGQDLAEMKQGMKEVVAEGMHLLVYVDYRSSARLIELKNHQGSVEEVVLKQYETPRNSVGLDETVQVLKDAFGAFPSESYGLIYWSHGDGWIPFPQPQTRWIGQDTGQGDRRMNLSVFAEALRAAPHLDFLLFDACFMQSIEVAYELRSFTDYQIASPTEIPGPGAPYDEIVPAMFGSNLPAKDLAACYFDYYGNIYDEATITSNDYWTAGTSISVLQSSMLEPLAQATRSALALLDGEPDFTALRASVQDYDRRTVNQGYVGYLDLYGLMKNLLDANQFAIWNSVFRNAQVYWNTTPKNFSQFAGLFPMEQAHGVSQYIPLNLEGEAAAAYRTTSWYRDAGFSQVLF